MKKALIVGINRYPNGSALSACVNDADEVAAVLERNGDNSVNFDIKKITDVCSKGDLKSAIKDCFSGDNDVALFYFSGHGFIDAIGGYIVTPDYSQEDWGVSMQDVLTIVNGSKCRNRVVVLDCCHSGFMGNVTSTGQTAAAIQDGVTILTASKSDESSIETNGHGVFTALLLDALKGGASDVTGHITPGGVYAYIDKALGPWQQRPVFKTNVTRFSPLRTVKPQVDSAILQKLTAYFPNPNQEHGLDPSYEPTNALDVEHTVVEPHANATNTAIFKDLQKLESVGLVIPCGEEHMYFAAMHSKSCRLTSVGQHYWRLAHDKRI
jgi:uncharacterized caspase-like protein